MSRPLKAARKAVVEVPTLLGFESTMADLRAAQALIEEVEAECAVARLRILEAGTALRADVEARTGQPVDRIDVATDDGPRALSWPAPFKGIDPSEEAWLREQLGAEGFAANFELREGVSLASKDAAAWDAAGVDLEALVGLELLSVSREVVPSAAYHAHRVSLPAAVSAAVEAFRKSPILRIK